MKFVTLIFLSLMTITHSLGAIPFFYQSLSYHARYEATMKNGSDEIEFYTIYFKPGNSLYMIVRPYNDRVKVDVVVYNQRIYNEAVIPISWEEISKKNFEDIIEASNKLLDWDLLLASQPKSQTRAINLITQRIDKALPDIKWADQKALSPQGKWVNIDDGTEYSRNVVNSFGFVKWIADGFYKPATGRMMDLNDLVEEHFTETPDNNWLIRETFKRNPYFGLDWIKNIGLKLNQLFVPNTTVNEIQFKSIPFYGFNESAGYSSGTLEFLLYYAAAKHPSKFYFLSFSSSSPWDKELTLLEHQRTAVAFPYIDYQGLLSVAYYESGKKLSQKELENRLGDNNVYLVSVELSHLFHLPPVKNLSIIYR